LSRHFDDLSSEHQPRGIFDELAGFTIVELALVVAIIAFLTAIVLQGVSVLQASRVHDVITLSQDLSIAIREFKSRYHLYPGDMTINAGNPQIPNLNALCVNGGNSNGVIEAPPSTESPCVPEMLFDSGLFGKVDRDPATGIAILTTYFGNPTVIAASTLPAVTGVGPQPPITNMPPSVVNVLLLTNLPCATAMEIDAKMDDGILNSGRVQGSALTCTPGGANDPVQFFAIGL
jgi:hypothetical protein